MLSGKEQGQWQEALFKAFSEDELRELLLHDLGEPVESMSSRYLRWKTVVGDVVAYFSRHDQEDRLIAAAFDARPGSASLLRLASSMGAAAAPDNAGAERLIRSGSFVDPDPWYEALGKVQVCVCRIEISLERGRKTFGTGFLIGRDQVMTNWHVVECIIETENNNRAYSGPRARASESLCRFDYKRLIHGKVNEGSTFGFATDWRVALSPNNPGTREPRPDELDFAIIRLAERAGEQFVGDRSKPPRTPRGWISLPDSSTTIELKPHQPLFIIQHPEGDPIKLALDTDAILSVNENKTRVRYTTNTEPGSSGSPCFDQNWKLIALHHAGDPNFAPDHRPEFNEGIPIEAIVKFLNGQKVQVAGKTS
jgi:hypothetical protein